MARTKQLTKRQVWLAEYLRCWNASEAARRAGYSWPDRMGYVVKQAMEAEIKEAVDARLMSAGEALDRLGEQARAAQADYLSVSKGGAVHVDMRSLLADGKGHLVKGVKDTAYGQQIEFYDAQTALVHIGRHHGLFVDRQEHTGPGGGPIQVDQRVQTALETAYGDNDSHDIGGDAGADE